MHSTLNSTQPFYRHALDRALRPAVSILVPLIIITCPVAVDAATFRLAVMGDSISAGSGVSGGSPNWVAQLNATGKFSFQNKAVGGATSTDVVNSQLPSVETLASQNKLDGSVLIIGGNDVTGNLDQILSDPQGFADSYTANIETALAGVAAAGPSVHQVFGNIPDITVTPLVQSEAASAGITPAQLQQLSAAIALTNSEADAYALSHGVPVLDLYSLSHALTAPFTLGGHTFTTITAPDDYHPAVWSQGLIANMVDTVFNLKWGLSLPILSDQQIVKNAGYTPNNLTTYYNIQPYVLLAAPEPATWAMAIIAGIGLLLFARKGCPHRDYGRHLVVLLAVIVTAGSATSAHADILHGIGVMGDSGSISSPSYKWPAQLQTNRGLNFGGSGLPYDHAVGGATSATLLSGGQQTKMAADVTAGKVTLGITFVGNDDWGTSAALAIAAGTATPAQTTAFQNSVVNNIQTAVNTEFAAGIQGMLLGSVEDVSLTPEGQSIGDPDAIARVQGTISNINSQLLTYAQTMHIPFVDFYTLGDNIYATGQLKVGGVAIDLTDSGSDPHDFWMDGLHPGIVGNAILGNMWMEAINIAYGTHLALYTDKQILALAGLSSSYTGETFSTSYNLANYIHFTPVPEPSTFVLGVAGVVGLGFVTLRKKFRRA